MGLTDEDVNEIWMWVDTKERLTYNGELLYSSFTVY